MRKEVRVGQTKVLPLRYSRHVQFGARIFFKDSGYQSHTVVCWFGRNLLKPINERIVLC
jgi:hypothetical protein